MIENQNPPPKRNPLKIRFSSTFELVFKFLPAGEFTFIIGPLILFGMFTWGLSPDDPQLRQGYFCLFLVVLPVGFILGNLLSRLSRRRLVFGLLDLAGGILAGFCFLWFFAKVSLIPPENPVEYIGWNWREWVQYYLLLLLVGVKVCRLGLIPNSYTGMAIASSDRKIPLYASASASGIIAMEFVGASLLGFWPCFFIFIIFWDVLAGWYHLWPKEGNLMDGPRLALQPLASISHNSRVLKVAIPFMVATQGIFWGITYTTTMWSQAWLGLFALTTGVGTVLFILLLRFHGGTLLARVSSLLPVIITGCLGVSLAFLFTRWVQPMDLIWSVVNGLSLGALVAIGANLYSPPKRAFWGPYRLLAFVLLFVLGIGGGIAYYWYDPKGEMYGSWVLLACVLIASICTVIYLLKERVKRTS